MAKRVDHGTIPTILRPTVMSITLPEIIQFSLTSVDSGGGNGDHSQHHGSAQYFHGIAAYADVGNALAFAACSDVHFAWAAELDPLANQHLLVTVCDFVLDHPTGGAAGGRSCGRVFAAVKKHSSSSFKAAFAPFGTQKVKK